MSLPPDINLFARHPNKYFVETGSFDGAGIQAAREAGFKHIRSIDIDATNKGICVYRFAQVPADEDLKFFCGDSATDLWAVIEPIEEPITFWLDAHDQLITEEPIGVNPFPLKKEIEQITRHPIKTHTIIIDDLLYMTNPLLTDLSYAELTYMIKEINWKYKFELVSNPVRKNILIAHL